VTGFEMLADRIEIIGIETAVLIVEK